MSYFSPSNSAIVNTAVHLSPCACYSVYKIASLKCNFWVRVYVFLKTQIPPEHTPKKLCQFNVFINHVWDQLFSYILPKLKFCYFYPSQWVKNNTSFFFRLPFLQLLVVDHLFMCLWSFSFYFFWLTYLYPLLVFSVELSVFFLLIFRSSCIFLILLLHLCLSPFRLLWQKSHRHRGTQTFSL